jgi:thiol-disulfide isomerase/thioredoxin
VPVPFAALAAALIAQAALAAALVAAAALAHPAGAAQPARSLNALPGTPAPSFALRDANGQVRKIEDYRGRVVLVNFWATWCAPCLSEMPALTRLERRLAGRPFSVLAINLGQSRDTVERFLKKSGIRLDVLYDEDMSAARDWKVRVLPASFVIDPERRVRYTIVGEADWTAPEIVSSIEKLLPR